MSAHASGCSCDMCSGPALWNALFTTSLPTLPPQSASSIGSSSIRPDQQQLPTLQRTTSRFHIPHWLLPTSRAEAGVAKDLESRSSPASNRLNIDAILNGHTRNPITLADFRAFLKSKNGGERLNELAAIEFLQAFNAYKATFFSLPFSEQAPHPYTVIENLSMLGVGDNAPNVPPKDQASPVCFAVPGSADSPRMPTIPPLAALGAPILSRVRGVSVSETLAPLYRQPARARAATFDGPQDEDYFTNQHTRKPSNPASISLPLLLDPATQPLRPELQVIIDAYLSGASSTLLMNIVSPSAISLALSETELTTHPSTLEPIATALTAHLNTRILPEFFDAAVINLSTATSRGRLLMALLVLSIALAWTVVFILRRDIFPRVSRLALTPFYLISVGYCIGSQTSLCFWLAWRGTREAKQYEEQEKEAMLERQFRAHDPHDWGDTDTLHPTISGDHAQSIYTLNAAEKGSISSKRRRKGESFHPMGDIKKSRWERILRMTGTATSTVKVEDVSVRRAQIKIAIKVTLWLIFATVADMAIVMAIP